jgi:hypothetical protein
MERVKDFFFDLSDIVISLIIIAVIFIVVTWKLSDTMPINLAFFNKADTTEEVNAVEPATPVEIEITGDAGTPSEQIGETPLDTVEPVIVEPVNDPEEQAVTVITIEIPSGASGDAIARILLDSALIDDVQSFNKIVADNGWGNKLRAGKFKLQSNLTNEEIARRLTGN